MAKAIVDDGLWEIVKPLLPPPKRRRRRYSGRKPLDDRQCLTGILFVLRTGIPWEYLPQQMGCGSGMSCWRRLRAWQKAGVWEKLHKTLLNKLGEAGKINWSRAVADSGSVRAVFGGRKQAQTPRIAGNRGQTPHPHGCERHSA